MLNILFTLSPDLTKLLSECDSLRSSILLTPTRPHTLRFLQWESMLSRLTAYTSGYENKITRDDIKKLLMRTNPLRLGDPLQMLVNYRQALNYIWEEWAGNREHVTTYDISKIITRLTYRIKKSKSNAVYPGRDLEELLSWLGEAREHPLIISSLIYGQLAKFDPIRLANPLANLVSYIYLSRDGYDINRMLSLETSISLQKTTASQAITKGASTGNWNSWIEIFIIAVRDQMTEIKSKLEVKQTRNQKNQVILSDRLQKILELLENPYMKITNREIARKFKISQITASRDLTKLTALGALASHGRGRSVYYTKI